MKLKFFLINIFVLSSIILTSFCDINTKLLIKIPTRSRPAQFFNTLQKYYQKLSNEVPFHFLITCDTDDLTMNNPAVIEKLKSFPHLDFNFHNTISKIDAYNKDVDLYDFDILLVVSDDMEPVVQDYDKIIVRIMNEHFPDYDGVLNFHDGFVGPECNTLPVLGKKFYDRFKYIYNPAYKSLFCDEELTLVSKILRKEFSTDQVIIKHNHPIWNNTIKWDDLYSKNEALDSHDRPIFKNRRANNFDISDQMLLDVCPKDWSILINTSGNSTQFQLNYTSLIKQIRDNNLEDRIEVIYSDENNSQALRNNALLRNSKGFYTSFLDDSCIVGGNYIKSIYAELQKNLDCVGITCGIFGSSGFKTICFSNEKNKMDNVEKRSAGYYNPMRRNVAIQFLFSDKNADIIVSWEKALNASALIKQESLVNEQVILFNKSR